MVKVVAHEIKIERKKRREIELQSVGEIGMVSLYFPIDVVH